MKNAKWLLIIFLFLIRTPCYSQVSNNSLKQTLDSLSDSIIPELNTPIDISLNNIPIPEFVRTISNYIDLNINVDPSINIRVNNNFSNVAAKDVIYMLCDEYDLECRIYGTIISIKAHKDDNSKILIEYNVNDDLLSYELEDCLLENFTHELSKQSNYNFFLTEETGDISVSGFVKSLNTIDALKGLAQSNNFSIKQEKDLLFIIEPKVIEVFDSQENQREVVNKLASDILIVDKNNITVSGKNLSCDELFQTVTNKLEIPYHQATPLEGKKDILLKEVDLKTFLNAIVSGTSQTYKFQEGMVFIGDRTLQEMKTNQLITFNNRRVDSLTHMLPKDMFPNISITEFPELNGLIVSGDADILSDTEAFFKSIDVSVPVVLIDVIIVDVSNAEELETGIEAGILRRDETVETGGTINSGIDYTMDSESVNNAITSLGLTRIGRVTPNFYVKLKALETKGIVNIRSTPQLSTLNGHPASMSIGETQYYVESSSIYQGSLTGQYQSSTKYSPVEAQLGVTIEPFVSGNGDVTLNIEVEQSDFTDRFEENAPPGLISRNFKSMIRVKDQEMVLLGGLEEISKEKYTSGLPGIAKIPIIGWLFTNQSKSNSKSRLNIFIKPTVLY